MNGSLTSESLTPSVIESYRRLREDAGRITPRPDRVLVELRGQDAKGWLQGQATNELRNVQPGTHLPFGLCNITGHLEGIYNVWILPDRLIVIGNRLSIDALKNRVQKNVVLEEVEVVEPNVTVVSVQGPRASTRLQKIFELPQLDAANVNLDEVEVTLLRSNRTGSGGWAIVIPADATAIVEKVESEFEPVDLQAYQTACFEFGSPIFGVDIDNKTFIPELGPAFEAGYINYKKGCYLGQEVLMRIHSRGHVNRKWMGIYVDGPVAAGDVVKSARRGEVGVITSAYESPDFGFIAAAFIRREVAYSGEPIQVVTADGTIEGELEDMPLFRIG